MLRHLAKRIAGLIVVLLAMSFIVFCLQSIIPADPARAIAGPSAPTATVEMVRKQLGLEDPVLVQYGRFLMRLSNGDLGTSVRTRQPVIADVGRYLMASLELILVAMVIALGLAAKL